VLLAGLSTGHTIGLAVVGGCFIGFALLAAFVAPRRWPNFPGQNGLPVFVIASFVLFAAMLTAVGVFGVESEAAKGAEASGAAKTVQVQEKEFKIVLPATLKTLAAGKVTFAVKNVGKIKHDLSISGPKVTGPKKTALIKPGGTATLVVTLGKGTYTLFCTVPGHRQLGMKATIKVA
jgi:uncharacterized cupredoxin-like copper-binding protein